jgi:DNA-directed RNA polymerase specialized sigma24 family protein
VVLSEEEITAIYEASRTLLPAAVALARRARLAPHIAEDLLTEAAVRVIKLRQRHGGENEIAHLPSYIWATYRNLFMSQLKKARSEQELSDKGWEALPGQADAVEELMRAILIEEVIKRMDERTTFIFEKRLLGYSFEEITLKYQDEFGEPVEANSLRSMFSRTVGRLRRELSDT